MMGFVAAGAVSFMFALTIALYAKRSMGKDRSAPRIAVLLPITQLVLAVLLCVGVAAMGSFDALLVAGVLTAAACCLVDVLFLRVLRDAVARDEARMQADVLANQIEVQAGHRRRMETAAREIGGMRSRMIDAIAVLDERLACEEQAVQGIQDLAATIPSVPRFCEHRVVDALVQAKAAACEGRGIAFESSLDVPDAVPFSDAELCAVFSNILDNAVEGCAQADAQGRFVRVSSRCAGGFFLITCENSCDAEASPASTGSAKPRALRLGSSDESPVMRHGWGQDILARLAACHEGDFSAHQSKGVYRVEMSLALR